MRTLGFQATELEHGPGVPDNSRTSSADTADEGAGTNSSASRSAHAEKAKRPVAPTDSVGCPSGRG